MNPVERILGVPFAWHGRDPRAGMDCHGVAVWLARQWGLEALELADLVAAVADVAGRDIRAVRPLELRLPRGWQIVPQGTERRGDWVWMRPAPEAHFVEHLEVVEDPGLSVTSLIGTGVCRVSWDAHWRARVHEIWRPACSA